MKQQLNRRDFLRKIACIASGLVILSHSRLVRDTQASNKPNIAGIGIGGRGKEDINGMASENIVILCDDEVVIGTPDYTNAPASFCSISRSLQNFTSLLVVKL